VLSRSQAKFFFLGGTVLVTATFLGLTVDSFMKLPAITHSERMTPMVIRGKHVWDEANCMGCHTLLGEGGYYAPELTKVYQRRGPAFIRAMLEDPESMYPGQRRMVRYDFTDDEIEALLAFFEWIGEMDLNGFPPEPVLFAVAMPGTGAVVERSDRPQVFNQMCIACHALAGQGGNVGPALDGVGDRMTQSDLEVWLTNPADVRPGTAMPDLPLDEAQIRELSAFLSTLRGEPGPEGDAPPGSPDAATEGPDVPPLPPGSQPEREGTDVTEGDERGAPTPTERPEAADQPQPAPQEPAAEGAER
jgi:nitric oxide reductase subunit C